MNQLVADAEPVEQLDQPRHADFAGKQAARNVARRILAAIGAEPAGDRVDIDADGAENFLLAAAAPVRGAERALRADCAVRDVTSERG